MKESKYKIIEWIINLKMNKKDLALLELLEQLINDDYNAAMEVLEQLNK